VEVSEVAEKPKPVAATEATLAPATAEDIQALQEAYSRDLRALLQTQRVYPRKAERRGQQGKVELAFWLDRQGRVLNARIQTASAHPLLNEAALRLLSETVRFPPLPLGLSLETRFTVWIDYRL